jgi:hypothetical protein
MKSRAFSAVALATIIIISIFSPAVMASTVYGPAQFERDDGKPVRVNDSFSLDHVYGNYTLCIRNGDGAINTSSSSFIFLNGVPVVGPEDFNQNAELIQKNVSLEPENDINIEVEMRSAPGSQITLWIEDESPFITIDSPSDDTVSSGNVTVLGSADSLITSDINLTCNGVASSVPVENGNFSTELNITGPTNVTISGTDLAGRVHSTTLLLDGDMLPESYEYQVGFDPLDPDSDSALTPENEAGNGISDGMEILGDQLPSFVKSRIGAVPFTDDSDSDGLSDYFELMKLGLITDIASEDTDSDGISDSDEDIDDDGLTNFEEQGLGTDPLKPDTDGDFLNDEFEVNSFGSNPLLADSDSDGLEDDSELKLSTNPNNPDTYNDGILDGLRTFTTTAFNSTLGVNVSITGIGDMSRQVRIVQDISPYYTNISSIVSPLVSVDVNGSFDYAVVSMKYDPGVVTDPSNNSLCYYNESLGLFLPAPSTLDPANHTISTNVTHLSTWGIFNLNTQADLYSNVTTFNNEIEGYVNGSATIPQNTINDSLVPLTVTKSYTVSSTGNVTIGDKVSFTFGGATINGPAPAPTPTPLPTSQDYSPILITMNDKGQTNWFGQGASYPAGVYQINATGWYTHWSPVPSTLACIDQGSDQAVRMYAWSSRGNNYPYANVSDHDRLGMHLTYGSNDSPLCAIRIAPGLLQFNHSGDKIGLWDNDDTYSDNTYSLSYVLSYVGNSISSLNLTDSDGDGLPNDLEMHGWMDTQGHVYYTDPYNSDTDSDGLTDCEEAGTWTTTNGCKYFHLFSDPTKADSDDDFLDDLEEFELGTNPLSADTDKDSITDFDDEYPLSPASIEPEIGVLEIGRALVLGAVFGECGIEGGSLAGFVDSEIASSAYYLVGWIGFSLVPVAGAVADARDAVQALINGDELGAALNAAGAFSGIGDGVKTGAAVGLFIGKYPEKALDVAKALGKYAFPHAPDLVKLEVLDIIFEGAATRLVAKYGDDVLQDLVVIAENNGNLAKTIGVAKSGGEVRWLEEGTSSWGWTHIKRPQRWQQITDKFGPKTEEEVQNMIFDTIRSSDQVVVIPGDQYKYVKNFPTKDGSMYQFSVIVSDRAQGIGKGNVITAHPGV